MSETSLQLSAGSPAIFFDDESAGSEAAPAALSSAGGVLLAAVRNAHGLDRTNEASRTSPKATAPAAGSQGLLVADAMRRRALAASEP